MNRIKNIVMAGLILLVMAGNVSALDLVINVPDSNVERIISAVLITHPNIECIKWDLQAAECVEKKYTDYDWALELARRTLVDAIKKGEQQILDRALQAKQAQLIQAEAAKIMIPTADDYQLTIKMNVK